MKKSGIIHRLAEICCLLSLVVSLTEASTGFKSPATFTHRQTVASTPNTTEKNENNDSTDNISNVTAIIPEWKHVLPAPLNNKTKTLQRVIIPGPGGRSVEVYLLGTAHVSIDSSRDVRLLLESVQPSILFLELCDQRISLMVAKKPENTTTNATNSASAAAATEKVGFWQKLRQRPKEANSMYGMAAGLLTNMQEDFAGSLGVELGGEFRVAYEYWDEHRTDADASRLHMILGDRPLYLTLTRAWESLRLWGKTKLIIGLLVSSFQKPDPDELREWMQSILQDDSGDLLTESIAELAQHFPTLEHVIIRERDAYMACKLYQTCRQLMMTADPKTKTHKLVAIVGAGHVQGMCQWLTGGGNGKTPEQVLDELIQIKKTIPAEDRQLLVHDVMEVNYPMLQEMVNNEMGV